VPTEATECDINDGTQLLGTPRITGLLRAVLMTKSEATPQIKIFEQSLSNCHPHSVMDLIVRVDDHPVAFVDR